MFDLHHRPLATRRVFLRRFASAFLVGQAIVVVSLGGGMAGYRCFEGMGWADAFANIIRDIYLYIAQGGSRADQRAAAFATFEDGYRVACLVDAVLESHRGGGTWTKVRAVELVGGMR